MKKLLVLTLGATIAAASFAPVAQAKHRMKKMVAAPMMMAPMNPRIAPNGDFYATPVNPGDGLALLTAPLGVPGAVVGGVTQPIVAGADGVGAGLGGLPGLNLLTPTP